MAVCARLIQAGSLRSSLAVAACWVRVSTTVLAVGVPSRSGFDFRRFCGSRRGRRDPVAVRASIRSAGRETRLRRARARGRPARRRPAGSGLGTRRANPVAGPGARGGRSTDRSASRARPPRRPVQNNMIFDSYLATYHENPIPFEVSIVERVRYNDYLWTGVRV